MPSSSRTSPSAVSYRLGKLEDVGRSESSDLGLRVFIGQQVAFVSSTDFSDAALSALPERAVAMAKLAPEDKYAGLAPRERLAKNFPDVEIDDPQEPSTVLLVERARAAEAAALEVPGVTNSEGGSADYGRTMVTLATSEGFLGGYVGTSRSVAVSVIAGEGTEMERDYDYAQSRFASDLESAEAVGKRAAMRAVKRLNPRKVKTQSVPVFFDPRVAPSLIGHFAGAISGAAIARGVSFLKDRMGEQVFAEGITIIDDPHRKRGPALQTLRRRRRRQSPDRADRQGPAHHLAAWIRPPPANWGSRPPATPRAAPAARPRRRPPISTWRQARSRQRR